MAKLSRPVVYTVVGVVAVWAAWLQFSPPPATSTGTTHTHTATSNRSTKTANAALGDQAAILPEDLHVHFPHYAGGSRDPFAPLVGGNQSVASKPGDTRSTPADGYSLTGIDSVNGAVSALVENPQTGDSDFLHVGDTWKGMTVVSIDADGVVLSGRTGQTRLTFVTTAPDTTAAPATGAGGVPSLSAVTPLPPMPTDGSQAADSVTTNANSYGSGRRGRRRNRGGDASTSQTESTDQQ